MKKYIKAAETTAVGPLTLRGTELLRCDEDYAGEVNIPDGVTEIADSAFFDCKQVTRVTIPNSVKRIGYYAFAHCSKLTDVDIPAGLHVGSTVFTGCPFNSTLSSLESESSATSEWNKLQHSLESDCDWCDPLYEETESGSKIQDTCGDVESDMGVWLEPSIQGGQGGIWIYNTDDEYLAGGIDYAGFNSDVIDMVLTSSSEEDFKREYRQYLEKQIKLHSDDEE